MGESPYTLAIPDLTHVLHGAAESWESLRGSRLFITGGTGFFGQWLVETFAYANEQLGLGARATVLTRDPVRARERWNDGRPPDSITYHAGDVRSFGFPEEPFDWCIHGASDATPVLSIESPEAMISTIVDGARHVLDFAAAQGGRGMRGVLVISSGAVYGRQPPHTALVSEQHMGGPDPTDPSHAYAEAKRMSELLSAVAARRRGVPVKIARCFTFVGPHLPLDAHFAIGNFIRSRITAAPIVLNGDGTPVRSYLYAADLAVWLWTILVRGAVGRAYNVGSERCVSILELAQLVATSVPSTLVIERRLEPTAGALPERYAPATARARGELGVRERVDLAEAIERTASWYESRECHRRPGAHR